MHANPWSDSLPSQAPATYPAPGFEEPGLRSLFYDGPAWKGRPARNFAWYGVPEGTSPDRPAPGILLVHGGGGTALANWVRLWNQRGFAALAMDTCGGVPAWSENPYNRECWPRHEFSGPAGWGRLEDAFLPPKDQWMFHAVSAVLYGYRLMESLPEVDAARIGVTGISWGAVLTCIAASLQPALSFAIPVYGCGNLNTPESSLMHRGETPEQRQAWCDLWDPCNLLPQATVPFLWIAGTNDIAFPLDAWSRSTHQVQGPSHRSLRIDYPHDHTRCFSSKTIFNFAQTACAGHPIPQLAPITLGNETLSCRVQLFDRQPEDVNLFYTGATGCSRDCIWHRQQATCQQDVISTALPPLAKSCFFTLRDACGCQWTSPLLPL